MCWKCLERNGISGVELSVAPRSLVRRRFPGNRVGGQHWTCRGYNDCIDTNKSAGLLIHFLGNPSLWDIKENDGH